MESGAPTVFVSAQDRIRNLRRRDPYEDLNGKKLVPIKETDSDTDQYIIERRLGWESFPWLQAKAVQQEEGAGQEMNVETISIIVSVVAVGAAVGTLAMMSIRQLRQDMDWRFNELRDDMRELRRECPV